MKDQNHQRAGIILVALLHMDLMNYYLYPYFFGLTHKIILPYMDIQPRWVGSWKDVLRIRIFNWQSLDAHKQLRDLQLKLGLNDDT